MEKSKLYFIIESFDKYDQNRCRKYIQSPYFNKSVQLTELFDLVVKHINKKSKKPLDKQYLWKKMHADRNYDDVRFRKYTSDLLKLIEGFIAQQVYEDTTLNQAQYLIKAVELRQLEKLYSGIVRNAKQLLEKQTFRPAQYYYHQYKIERNYLDLVGFDRQERTNYEAIVSSLDQFYFAEKLGLYCDSLVRRQDTAHDYKMSFTSQIFEHLGSADIAEFAPIVQIYYQVYLTFTYPEQVDNYHKFKSLLDEHAAFITARETYQLFTYAQNFCAFRLNEGKIEFLNELFELYQTMIRREIIFEKGRLSPWDFKNIIVIASRVGEFEWAKSFIDDYAERLPEDFRDNAVSFNLARLYFDQKKYDEVIKLLRTIEYDDISYNLESKTMLLITYFETDEIDALYFLLESFRTYLNRHKEIPEQRRNYYKNLIRFTKKLSKIIPRDQKAIDKIKADIEATASFNVRWLNEKIAELEKKRS